MRECTHIISENKYLVRTYLRADINESDMQDISNLRTLEHPNIVMVFEIIEDIHAIHVIFEYVYGGPIFDKLSKQPVLTENTAKAIITQVISAISYLHDKQMVYGRLNPETLVFLY